MSCFFSAPTPNPYYPNKRYMQCKNTKSRLTKMFLFLMPASGVDQTVDSIKIRLIPTSANNISHLNVPKRGRNTNSTFKIIFFWKL